MNILNTPKDYTDNKISVYFEVADFKTCIKVIQQSDFSFSLTDLEEKEYGFVLSIANQVIPEIIRVLLKDNHAVYQVKRMI